MGFNSAFRGLNIGTPHRTEPKRNEPKRNEAKRSESNFRIGGVLF